MIDRHRGKDTGSMPRDFSCSKPVQAFLANREEAGFRAGRVRPSHRYLGSQRFPSLFSQPKMPASNQQAMTCLAGRGAQMINKLHRFVHSSQYPSLLQERTLKQVETKKKNSGGISCLSVTWAMCWICCHL